VDGSLKALGYVVGADGRFDSGRGQTADEESVDHWPDRNEKLGKWADAFATAVTNPSGSIEEQADFSKPRITGQATKRRRNQTKD
jgi:hypothetical protein